MSGILFVHNNFPAQFGFLAEALMSQGRRCAAIASGSEPGRAVTLPVRRWHAKRGSTKDIFPAATRAEADMVRGMAAAECAVKLRDEGFDPDLIIGHPGWGETIFLKDVFPRAKQILYGEFYYHADRGDVGFDPEFGALSLEGRFKLRAKNATMALAYAEADRIVCPTPFQRSVLPESFQARATIIHEGVDPDRVRPDPGARLALRDGRVLDRASGPVVTFINRCFEPLRGFHIFMRALPRLLAEVPDAEVVLIGADTPGCYGGPPPGGIPWRRRLLDELKGQLDPSRVHFTGRLPHDRMLAALSISAAHVYYTYPFVLSWSLLEAMASECLILGSDTAPVRDAITHGVNGLLLDFFDVDALSEALIAACRSPEAFQPLRRAARETVLERFDRNRTCLPAWLALIDEVGAQAPQR